MPSMISNCIIMAKYVRMISMEFMMQNIIYLIFVLSVSLFAENFKEPEMVFVQGGKFKMGNNCGQENEKPEHDVIVSDFYIGKYEVTQAQWKSIMGDTPSFAKGDNLPVEKVSWNDCQKFIKRLNDKTKKKYRLLTEAEWEYAAHGGNKSRGYKFSGSDSLDLVAWFVGNSGNETSVVGMKKPNELGIHDMNGNVSEWCKDIYGDKYYLESSVVNPSGMQDGSNRVCRGGNYLSSSEDCRLSIRVNQLIGFRALHYGLRLAMTP